MSRSITLLKVLAALAPVGLVALARLADSADIDAPRTLIALGFGVVVTVVGVAVARAPCGSAGGCGSADAAFDLIEGDPTWLG
jgi:hypothetical protein